MKIMTFDPATETGFAIGVPGTVPRFGVFRAREKDAHELTVVSTVLEELTAMWRLIDNRADLFVFERPLPPGAHKGSAAAVIAYMVCGSIVAWARAKGIQCYMADAGKWRMSVIGTTRAPKNVKSSRDWLKQAVLNQLIAERVLPVGCKNDNIGDAVGIWKYAEIRYGRVTPQKLVLFGEHATA